MPKHREIDEYVGEEEMDETGLGEYDLDTFEGEDQVDTGPVKEEYDWQAESDMHTLMQAREIKSDPKRYRAAMNCARKKRDELKALTD